MNHKARLLSSTGTSEQSAPLSLLASFHASRTRASTHTGYYSYVLCDLRSLLAAVDAALLYWWLMNAFAFLFSSAAARRASRRLDSRRSAFENCKYSVARAGGKVSRQLRQEEGHSTLRMSSGSSLPSWSRCMSSNGRSTLTRADRRCTVPFQAMIVWVSFSPSVDQRTCSISA